MKTTSPPVPLLRAELINIAESWQLDSKPQQPSDIFFPSAHVRALALDRSLVIGMRGAGKSFWSEVFTDDTLRPTLTKFVQGYGALVKVCSIRWDQGRSVSTVLPDSSDLTQILDDGLEPRLLWLTLILNELREECHHRGITVELPATANGWAGVLQWAKSNPDAIRRAFEQLNAALARDAQVVLVVVDGLDRMAGRLAQSVDWLRGLLQLLLDSRHLKGLRFKVFLREDITMMPSVLSFPDASKLINEAIHLKWSREDIYALHWHKLAQQSPKLQNLIEENFGPAQSGQQGYQHPLLAQSSPNEEKLKELLGYLAPSYMGNSASKGHTYSWWYKHLADGKSRVSPRTFAVSLKESLKSSDQYDKSYVFTSNGIKQGVRAASDARIEELKEDYFWVPDALFAFNDRLTPAFVKEIYGIWNGIGIEGQPTPKLIRELCIQKKIFLPWDDFNKLKSPSQKLRDILVELGILILRDEGTRLDMPDIYRLGYRIRKRGGVSPRRR